MKSDMDKLARRSWFIRYWKINGAAEMILEYQKEVDTLRINLLASSNVYHFAFCTC